MLVAALSLLLSGSDVLAQSQPMEPAAAPNRIVLLVDEIKAIRNFPVVVAERMGYLKGDGVVVTVMNIRDDVSTADMLVDGRVDAVMAYYHHNIVNQSEGRNFEAIVTLGVTPGAKVLVANQVKDKFKTLGSSPEAPARPRRRSRIICFSRAAIVSPITPASPTKARTRSSRHCGPAAPTLSSRRRPTAITTKRKAWPRSSRTSLRSKARRSTLVCCFPRQPST